MPAISSEERASSLGCFRCFSGLTALSNLTFSSSRIRPRPTRALAPPSSLRASSSKSRGEIASGKRRNDGSSEQPPAKKAKKESAAAKKKKKQAVAAAPTVTTAAVSAAPANVWHPASVKTDAQDALLASLGLDSNGRKPCYFHHQLNSCRFSNERCYGWHTK